MDILVVAPHPDDEVLGCGGTMIKHAKSGDKVHVCYVTTTYTPDWSEEYLERKKLEIEKSNKLIGVFKNYFLGYPTVKLDTISQKKLNDSFKALIDRISPEIVYLPFYGDINMDHKIVFHSALVATRPIGCRTKRVLCYETLSETEWGDINFNPNYFVDITDYLEKKIEAMRAYKTEIKQFPHPRSEKAIEALAIKRGSEVNLHAAEAFILIREIC